MMDFGENK